MKIIPLLILVFIAGCATTPAPKAEEAKETEKAAETPLKILSEMSGITDFKKLEDLQKHPLLTRKPRWKCTIQKQQYCSDGKCAEVKPDAWINLDKTKNTYERCNSSACITKPLDVVPSGIYTSFAPKGTLQGFLKVLNDGTSFSETVAFGLTLVNAFGFCLPE